MKVNNIGSSNIINIYSENKRRIESKGNVTSKDTLQISNVGRSLSNLSIDSSYMNSPEKIEAVKRQIEQGTYKPSPRQVAQKMLDNIKGREI